MTMTNTFVTTRASGNPSIRRQRTTSPESSHSHAPHPAGPSGANAGVRDPVDPDAYLAPVGQKPVEPPAAAHGQARWTCPMHPEIVRDGPGNCPICGMALESVGLPVDGPNPELIDM